MLMAILAIGAVSAADDINETLTVDDVKEAPVDVSLDDVDEKIADTSNEEVIAQNGSDEQIAADENQNVLEDDIDDKTFRHDELWFLSEGKTEYDVVNVWWIDEFGAKSGEEVLDGNFTLTVTNSHDVSKTYFKHYNDSEPFYDWYYYDEMDKDLSHISWKLGDLDLINETGHYKFNVKYNDRIILDNWNFQLTRFDYIIVDPLRGEFDKESAGYKWPGIYVDYPYDVCRILYDKNNVHFEVKVNDVVRPGRDTPKPIVWNLTDLGINTPGKHKVYVKALDKNNNTLEEFEWEINAIEINDTYRVKWDLIGIPDYDCNEPAICLYCPSNESIPLNISVNDVNVYNNMSIPGKWVNFTLKDLKIVKNGLYQIKINDWDQIENVREIFLYVNVFIDSYIDADPIEFNYNGKGSTYLNLDGATGVEAYVIGHPEAHIKIDNNRLTVYNLNAGSYQMNITTITDDFYTSVSKIIPIVVKKISGSISANSITVTYGSSKTILINLKDSKTALSGKVTIKLNGVTYNRGINSKGQVSLTLPTNLVPKTYSAVITYGGSGNYVKSTKTIKIIVKKAIPKLTAADKTFKSKIKVKKYFATLKTDKGKAMRKVKLSLKINKKTYYATTDAKGLATFKITKLTKKSKYNAVVRFAGNKYYAAKSKSVKITIK